MGNLDLGTLIVSELCGIGLIQFIMWIVVMIRHPGLDDVRLDLSAPTPTQPNSGDSTTMMRQRQTFLVTLSHLKLCSLSE